MTLDEAYEVLGLSKHASHIMVRVAYKEKRKAAGTKFESEIYSEAYLTIIGTRPADEVQPQSPPPKSERAQSPNKSSINPVRSTSREVRLQGRDIAKPNQTPVTSEKHEKFKEFVPLDRNAFERLPTSSPSRSYASYTAKALGIIKYETGPDAENWDLAIAPDSTTFLLASADWCYKWNISSGKVIEKLGDHKISDSYGCDISLNGQYALTTGSDGEIVYRDYISGKKLSILEGHTNISRKVRFLPDSMRAISVGWDGKVLLWHLPSATFKELSGGKSRGHITGLDISRDGKNAYISDGHTLDVWDLESCSLSWTKYLCSGSSFHAIAISPNETVAVCSSQSSLHWIDLKNRRVIQRYNLENRSIEYLRPEPAAAFSRDGRWCLTGASNGLILWSTSDRTPLRRLEGHTNRVDAVRFSHDDSFALSTGHDRTVKLWRL